MKTPKSNADKGLRPSTLFQLGVITAMAITLVGFEYSTVDIKREKVVTSKMQSAEIEVINDKFEVKKPELPRQTQEEQPKNDLPKNINSNTTIQQMTNNIVTTTNKNEVSKNAGFNEGDSVTIVDFSNNTVVLDEVFVLVEDMPTYEELLTENDKDKRRILTDKKMLELVYKTIRYPEIPLQQGISGKVHVSFVVNKKGEVSDVKVERGVHPDLDAEAVRAVKTLPDMVPGKQRDKEVSVRFYLPIEYKIKK